MKPGSKQLLILESNQRNDANCDLEKIPKQNKLTNKHKKRERNREEEDRLLKIINVTINDMGSAHCTQLSHPHSQSRQHSVQVIHGN